MDKGLFVISLDFELFWGLHDAKEINDYYDNVNNVRVVIPRLLSLFKKYQVNATFAVVGAIYHHSFEEFKLFSKDVIEPQYQTKGLSPYEEVNVEMEKKYPELHFAPEIIKEIRDAGQEIGTHTYSHYYSTELGSDLSSFESDIKKALEIAKIHGDNPKSIVFPRNQLGKREFLDVLKENGITTYRGNPYEKYDGMSFFTRLYRFCSAYLPISDETVVVKQEDGIINIPASHFLRPYSSIDILNKLQLIRIKNSMKKAAKEKRVFHLWWHPHNLGKNINENLLFLEQVLQYYLVLSNKYGYESVSMISDSIFQDNV